jgi:hypothetical protein
MQTKPRHPSFQQRPKGGRDARGDNSAVVRFLQAGLE